MGTAAGDSAIAFTDALPLAFEGGGTVPNLSLRNVGKAPFDERQSRILRDMYAGHRLEGAVTSGLELRQEVAQQMADEMNTANRNAINKTVFDSRRKIRGFLVANGYLEERRRGRS